MRQASRCGLKSVLIFALLLAASQYGLAQATVPPAFAKPVPDTIADLQAIEKHVHKLVDKLTLATVCLRVGAAQGSGVIVDAEGHILTAGHVSGDADQDVVIILFDGRRLRGKTLGANNGIDSGMAIITEKGDFTHAPLAKSGSVKKGDWCLSLGHPGGYKPGRPPVVRVGRLQDVSAKSLTSDCALVGGDSGGPLFDMHGRVIGIHSRIGGRVSSNVHVPIDTYRETWGRLAASEVWGSSNPFLDLFKREEAYLGVRPTPGKKGLRIESVTPGSPAEKAGLKANDLILKVDNRPVATSDDLAAFLKSHRPGARVNIQVRRGNEAMVIAVVLGKRAN